MTRDQITQAMMAQQRQQQQQQMPGRPLGSPFAPAPVLQGPPPVAGTPTPPIAAPTPQYGFETGYKAAAGSPGGDTGKDETMKKLMQLLGMGA